MTVPDLLPALPGETVGARVTRTLRDAVLRGTLPDGTRLPGHRALAAQLGVSRNTVVDALDTLTWEGFVQAAPRSGTRVVRPARPQPGAAPPLPLSDWARRALAGQVQDVAGTYAVDFRPGQPVPDLYPAAWTQALARRAAAVHHWRDAAGDALPDPLGPLETRRALAAYLNAERGAQVTPDMVMLTGGTQGALDALARAFLEPGRTAAIETPTYAGAHAALSATGATLHPVPVDDHGLIPAHLPAQATLLYATPACQYPTTATLPAARRQAVLDWAAPRGTLILEDDYAADLVHGTGQGGRAPAVMQALDPARVILLGSFSKSLAPVTRSGFLAGPPAVIQVLAGTRPLTDRAPGTLDALALADLLGSGAYARHVRRTRPVLAERHEAATHALRVHFPDWQVTPARAGLHLHVALPPDQNAADVIGRAARGGVALGGVDGQDGTLLLAFAHLPPPRLRQGLARLARALHPSHP